MIQLGYLSEHFFPQLINNKTLTESQNPLKNKGLVQFKDTEDNCQKSHCLMLSLFKKNKKINIHNDYKGKNWLYHGKYDIKNIKIHERPSGKWKYKDKSTA